jgi:holliday junction DNA helicase RuvB
MDDKQKLEVNDCVPTVIEHFVGQKQVVNRVKVMLEATWNDGVRAPHCLLTGSPGLGKTELAHILAKEMGAGLKEVIAQNLSSPQHLNGFLMDSSDKDVLLIDEIHELPSNMQTALYRAMENGLVFVNGAVSKKPLPVKLPSITILGATTDMHKLLKPLMDRFKLILPFEFYSKEELELLLRNRTKGLKWEVQDEVFSMIAQRGHGVPRIALRLLSSVRLTSRAENSTVLTTDHAQKTLELEGVEDAMGLGRDEKKYLKILAEHNTPIRLNEIASKLGINNRNVSEVLELYLIRSGLITKLDNGRTLTAAGLQYVKAFCEDN